MGRYDAMEPGEVRALSYPEYQLLQVLYCADSQVYNKSHVLDNRLKAIKRGALTMGMLKWSLRHLLEECAMTMTRSNWNRFEEIRKHGEIVIKINPLSKPSTDMIVNSDQFNIIATAAVQHECSMCLKDGKEIKSCPLRKALMDCAPPRDSCVIGCEYQHMIDAFNEMQREEEANGD